MSADKFIPIVKASGEIAKFDEEKLKKSLTRSGASPDQVDTILKNIDDNLYPGIPSKKIYQLAFKMLNKLSKPLAARYKLKSAIMELGPSGFPFEKYVASILKHQGYRVQTSIIVQGKCVNHEVDVIAEKEDAYFIIECKYHNHRGTVSDVKIPLYINSRFKDIEENWPVQPEKNIQLRTAWVVTNTRFTFDAIQYGNCAGLKLLGWDYPHKGSLNQIIERLGLYPLTCLTTLSKHEKQNLLDSKVVLCREICDDPALLKVAGINEERIKGILEESYELCKKLNYNKS
ncbi:MAG: PD-(D/E)XK nuclease superfamily protein [Bacteroidia bacterium]